MRPSSDLNTQLRRIMGNVEKITPLKTTLNSRISVLESCGRRYILKERYPANLRNECRILCSLQRRGFLHIPKTYGIADIGKRKVLVQAFIEGEKIEKSSSVFSIHADKIAMILAELHLLTRRKQAAPCRFMTELINTIQQLIVDTKAVAGFARKDFLSNFIIEGERYFDFFVSRVRAHQDCIDRPIHLSLMNSEMELIADRAGKIYMLDWDNGCYGDYVFDIAQLNYIYPGMNRGRFIELFQKRTGVSDDLLLKTDLYLPLILMRKAFYMILHVMTYESHQNIPLRISAAMSAMVLRDQFDRIDALYRKFRSVEKSDLGK